MTPSWQNPLTTRYASGEMLRVVSDDFKYQAWRQLWIALAETERELGLPIKNSQIAALRRHADDIPYKAVAAYEKRLRHDVMAHVRAYGDQAPAARGILHLGATSCFVTDNADLLILREGLSIIEARLGAVVRKLGAFAGKHRATACLAYTHFQTAQPTTMGKRACLWIQDLLLDAERLELALHQIKFLGAKGTTGTQASFLQLFGGSHAKVKELDRRVARKMGFFEIYPVTGQTYSRKVDDAAASALSSIAQSCAKFAYDMRLLQGLSEMEEPFEKEQVGSSAMPYKRNPMRSERMTALARFVISLQQNTAQTAATQWLERTLDDSANRRLVIPQMLLAADALLILYENVVSGLVVHKEVVAARLRQEAAFMATEGVLMAASKKGGDRQELHERIRKHAMAARERIRRGEPSDLLERIASDKFFKLSRHDIENLCDPSRMVGRAPEQVSEFMRSHVEPFLRRQKNKRAPHTEVAV